MTAAPSFPRCLCGHSMLAHDLNSQHVRTACSVYDDKGQCPCRKFTAKES